MNGDFQQWLASRLPFAGLMGWSAQFPDSTCASHSYVNWIASSQFEQAFARLAGIVGILEKAPGSDARLGWTFEHLRIHLVIRGDGASLALFVQNRADNPSLAAEPLLAEFEKLSLA